MKKYYCILSVVISLMIVSSSSYSYVYADKITSIMNLQGQTVFYQIIEEKGAVFRDTTDIPPGAMVFHMTDPKINYILKINSGGNIVEHLIPKGDQCVTYVFQYSENILRVSRECDGQTAIQLLEKLSPLGPSSIINSDVIHDFFE